MIHLVKKTSGDAAIEVKAHLVQFFMNNGDVRYVKLPGGIDWLRRFRQEIGDSKRVYVHWIQRKHRKTRSMPGREDQGTSTVPGAPGGQ